MEPKPNMLWNVEIGKVDYGRGQSMENYWVLAPDMMGAIGIALTKAQVDNKKEYDDVQRWQAIEAKLISVEGPLD